jgi:hypothetical protein
MKISAFKPDSSLTLWHLFLGLWAQIVGSSLMMKVASFGFSFSSSNGLIPSPGNVFELRTPYKILLSVLLRFFWR